MNEMMGKRDITFKVTTKVRQEGETTFGEEYVGMVHVRTEILYNRSRRRNRSRRWREYN